MFFLLTSHILLRVHSVYYGIGTRRVTFFSYLTIIFFSNKSNQLDTSYYLFKEDDHFNKLIKL